MDEVDLPAATDRLSFSVWREDDLPLATAIWGDAAVTELTGGPFNRAAVEQRLALEINNWHQHHFQYWPILHRRDGRLMGCCGLRPTDEERVAEMGFQLVRDAWGHGFASEAAKSVVEWARTHDFVALIAGHHPANHASKRALQRLGFHYTHDELYPPTSLLEPCYRLPL